jgi:hypothetical protein
MGNSNKKKSETLGMPHGTACHRLRKNILFHLLCRLEENICYRCGKTIESVDDLSVEHIKPWEGISAELFWDISNIDFSHLRCNVPHRRPGHAENFKHPFHQKTVNAPEGKAWCSGHKDYVAIDGFHTNVRNINGVASYCKECRTERKD